MQQFTCPLHGRRQVAGAADDADVTAYPRQRTRPRHDAGRQVTGLHAAQSDDAGVLPPLPAQAGRHGGLYPRHVEHFGGVKGVISEGDTAAGGVQVIAPAGFMEQAISENLLAGTPVSRLLVADYLMLRLRADKAAGKTMTFNLIFPGLGGTVRDDARQ